MADIRQRLEEKEKLILSPYASFSTKTKGRKVSEEPSLTRTEYQRDKDRILHCKAFRRLKHKTQVFLAPEGDHYRTRLTHTLEVSQISRSIARALALNEDLTEAIALGHDLGHTPFGHAGERALDSVCSLGFVHSQQSLRVVDYLEKDGLGLNLTYEVRDGILNHETSGNPYTLEGAVVRLSDKIAYIHHDMDDAIRAGILKEDDIPKSIAEYLGRDTKERLNTLINDVIYNSIDTDKVAMTDATYQAMTDLRKYMFDNLYTNPRAKSEERKAKIMLVELYEYYIEHMDELPENFRALMKDHPKERIVCDYIAGMTDQYSILKFEELFVPYSWKVN